MRKKYSVKTQLIDRGEFFIVMALVSTGGHTFESHGRNIVLEEAENLAIKRAKELAGIE